MGRVSVKLLKAALARWKSVRRMIFTPRLGQPFTYAYIPTSIHKARPSDSQEQLNKSAAALGEIENAGLWNELLRSRCDS